MKAKILIIFLILLLAACAPAVAPEIEVVETDLLNTSAFERPMEEKAPIPFHREPYRVDFQAHENISTEVQVQYKQVVESANAPWIQIVFGDYNLGQESYLTITSLQDGGQQKLDSESMVLWNSQSAYFNGDAVEIELHIAPSDSDVFFTIEELVVGDWVSGKLLSATAVADSQFAPNEPGEGESQCGTTDDRTATTDAAVGRIMPVGCTGWIVSNGAHLTAGHCVGPNMQTLQFNVPASRSDGTVVNPPPEDQYPIEAIGNIDWFDDGNGANGNDWAVFEAFANNNTGLLPVQAQNAFYRMSRDSNPTSVRVTGYGTDTGTSNQTLQTHAGAFLGETVEGASDIIIEYTVDTEGGNSGSPVINTANGVTIGIHTNGGCNLPGTGNSGTSFEHDDLEAAITDYPSANTIYVDNGHPIVNEDGTVFRPFDTILEGVNAATGSSPVISVVAGSYNETITINTPMRIEAPVGIVTIGQ